MIGCEILPSARTASEFSCMTTRNIIARIRPLVATLRVSRTAIPRSWIFVALCLTVATSAASAAQTLRIGLQKTGTFAWQLDVIRRHGLADSAGLDLAITEFASPDAGKLALNSGAVDLVVSDWLWVARERALGAKLLFYPYSSAAGAVMVRADSPLRGVGDLKGRVLAVAGGPLDKSWLIVRAAALRRGVDLKRETTLQYGAPPLIFQKSQQSDVEASLNFWNFCARLEALGYRRLLDVQNAEIELGLKQPVALIGFVFSEPFAATHRNLIDSFIAVTQQANDIMLKSDSEWAALRPLMQVEDDATFEAYRSRTREGMPRQSLAAEAADARLLFKMLADTGGQQLVGPASELDSDLYYHPSAHGE
jgi:NitT/TauT family transport system substrate-binding protein